jgi:Tol biopolymer transport system component
LHVAFALQEAGNYDLWIGDIEHGTKARAVEGAPAQDFQSPVWTPDGRVVVYGAGNGIDWLAADGSREPEPFFATRAFEVYPAFSPDGLGKRKRRSSVGGY